MNLIHKNGAVMSKQEKGHSLNKSQLAKKLQERFVHDTQKMSLARATHIIDELFGIAEENEERDGIFVEQLRQEMRTSSIEKIVQKRNNTKTFRYKDLIYNKVTIPGFGTFKVAFRASREGKHPSEQKKVQIEETFVVTFNPGKALKAAFKKGVSTHIDSALRLAEKAHQTKESIRIFKSKND
jgi:nucleoid DNA-binding protein